MHARALRVPVFLGSSTPNGALCAPPTNRSFAASYLTPKINKKNYWTRAARVKGFPEVKYFPSDSNFFLSTGPQRLWNMRSPDNSPPPRPAHRSLLILPAILWCQNYLSMWQYGLTFYVLSFFYIVFWSFLFLILLSFLISSNSSLLSLLVLFFVFLFFSSYILICLWH